MADKKKTDAKNTKILLDLLNLPANQTCADCYMRGPRWASWNIGVFLCLRCAGIHRKLGVHISKVKSVTLDSWTQEQVQNMQQNGNGRVNMIYLGTTSLRTVPEDDLALEIYIREKYEKKHLSNTGSDRNENNTRQTSAPTLETRAPGAPNRIASSMPSASLLRQLQEMGFGDEDRCSKALRKVNGNLQAAIDLLILEGSQQGSSGNYSASSRPSAHTSEHHEVENSYRNQVETLARMGFVNRERSLLALVQVDGVLEDALELLGKLPASPTKASSGAVDSAFSSSSSSFSSTSASQPKGGNSNSLTAVSDPFDPFVSRSNASTRSHSNLADSSLTSDGWQEFGSFPSSGVNHHNQPNKQTQQQEKQQMSRVLAFDDDFGQARATTSSKLSSSAGYDGWQPASSVSKGGEDPFGVNNVLSAASASASSLQPDFSAVLLTPSTSKSNFNPNPAAAPSWPGSSSTSSHSSDPFGFTTGSGINSQSPSTLNQDHIQTQSASFVANFDNEPAVQKPKLSKEKILSMFDSAPPQPSAPFYPNQHIQQPTVPSGYYHGHQMPGVPQSSMHGNAVSYGWSSNVHQGTVGMHHQPAWSSAGQAGHMGSPYAATPAFNPQFGAHISPHAGAVPRDSQTNNPFSSISWTDSSSNNNGQPAQVHQFNPTNGLYGGHPLQGSASVNPSNNGSKKITNPFDFRFQQS